MFVKIFGSILDSTVWQTPAPTRVVWITMLAMSDETGFVAASIPGLARRAGVTREECEAALEAFLAPDPDSRTKDHDGRRIETADGGWVLLNYAKYRAIRNKEDRREYQAEWARTKRVGRIDKCRQTSTESTQAEVEAEVEAEAHTGGGGEGPARAFPNRGKSGPVAQVLAAIGPLWKAKYGRRFVASREERRSLGILIQSFVGAGEEGERELADLPDWYGRFLSDERDAYVKRAHSLEQFLNDINAHRLSDAERLHPNGRQTAEEYQAEVAAERRARGGSR